MNIFISIFQQYLSRASFAALQLWCRRRSAPKTEALNLDEWNKLYGLCGSVSVPMMRLWTLWLVLISNISQPFAHQNIMAKECCHMPSYRELRSARLSSRIKFNLKCGAMKPRNDHLLAPMACLSSNSRISQWLVTALRLIARGRMELLLLFGAAVCTH